MKQYKLKQPIVVTETGAAVKARVIKRDTVIYEKANFYHVEDTPSSTKVVFRKDDVESTPEIFEFIPEEKSGL